ncbi:MAG TPA: phage tail protein, partial [Chloroflexota bacterium]|nr:phage tail protein [Chloroflexota bacterium]
TDLGSAGTTLQRRPNDGTFGPLTGGDDGLVGLSDTDFVGNSAGGTGLRAMDQTIGIRILIVPGRATSAVHNSMITYAEVTRSMEMFAILDPPVGMTAAQIDAYVVSTASLRGLSEFGAIYWPNIKILNPSTTVFGKDSEIVVPPSGHIAGMYARTDASTPGGVYIPPAGEETGRIIGATGVETEEVFDENKRDVIFPDLINPITKYPGAPIHCDGARTLKDNGNFPTIGERRGVIFIEQSCKDFLRVFKHKNNNEALRATVDRSVTSFLLIQMNNDAFQTKDPKTAFFVDVGAALNPPSVVFARQLIIRLGLATNKPAEFIILRVSQDTRALEEELAAAAAA